MTAESGTIAVSLHYDGSEAPRVSAKGEGDVARRILELATEHDIPIYQNAELLQLLSRVELDSEIPPTLYIAVAEIIAFAYRLKDRVPDNYAGYGAYQDVDDADGNESTEEPLRQRPMRDQPVREVTGEVLSAEEDPLRPEEE
ncbi:MAG: EscU/YscU/HrcU family type III secretion system export apparatus switch protein [Spongiibacter sp.]|nr:EscU/YscU/HrcU family type III secretion system export apparatus switch protein [Spongiibacter sp.]